MLIAGIVSPSGDWSTGAEWSLLSDHTLYPKATTAGCIRLVWIIYGFALKLFNVRPKSNKHFKGNNYFLLLYITKIFLNKYNFVQPLSIAVFRKIKMCKNCSTFHQHCTHFFCFELADWAEIHQVLLLLVMSETVLIQKPDPIT